MGRLHDDIWRAMPAEREPDGAALRFALESIRHAGAASVLDVGCGDGRGTAELARAAPRVVGVDPSEVALGRARDAYPQLELARANEDGSLPFADVSFDAVTCLHVLEHALDTQALLSEMRRVIVGRGLLVVAVPYWGRVKAAAVALTAFERHHDPLEPTLRFYTARSLTRLLHDFGFERTQFHTAGGLPLLRETLLARAWRA